MSDDHAGTPGPSGYQSGLCANCDGPLRLESRTVFCGSACREEAKFVRYWRAVIRDGRADEPDVAEAITIRAAAWLHGGYEALGRQLSPATRELIRERDCGVCRLCGAPGTEIDHIDGSSNDPENLQLLCADCHRLKTQDALEPASGEHVSLILQLRKSRVDPPVPTRSCDDEGRWAGLEPQLRRHQLQRLDNALLEAGISAAVSVRMTRAAKAALLQDHLDDEADAAGEDGVAGSTNLDEDTGYGPTSYFARSMDRRRRD